MAEGAKAARRSRADGRTQPGLTLAEANAAAWQIGRTLLERAIQERLDFAFETTLGGNTIPEEKIRRRYERSRLNLIQLLPSLTALRVYDNSDHAEPEAGGMPAPQLVQTAGVAKPIVVAALQGRLG